MASLDTGAIKQALTDLADERFQDRNWSSGASEPTGSLADTVTQLFDDSGLGDALGADSGEPAYSASADVALRAVGEQTDRLIARDLPPVELLADPDLAALRQTAAEALFEILRGEAHQQQ